MNLESKSLHVRSSLVLHTHKCQKESLTLGEALLFFCFVDLLGYFVWLSKDQIASSSGYGATTSICS